MLINVLKLHNELVSAGIPIEGVAASEPPRIDFLPEATAAQRRQAEAIVAAHIPEDYQDKRQRAYLERGVTVEAMVTALWEHLVEGNTKSTDAIQSIRNAVKQDFPLDTAVV